MELKQTEEELVIETLTPLDSVIPTIRGPRSYAWQATRVLTKRHLCAWTILAPMYFEGIRFYYVELTSLETRQKKFHMATHEIQITVIAPGQLLCVDTVPNLADILFKSQFYSKNDKTAFDLVTNCVSTICVGKLDPIADQETLMLTFGSMNTDLITPYIPSKDIN